MRLRAEQVGSLLRPPALLAARADYASGRIGLADLTAQEDAAIRRAVARQQAIGLDVFSDGEMRRGSWLTGMADSVDGFEPDSVMLEWHGPGGGREKTTARIVGGRLHKRRMLSGAEVALMQAIHAAPFKITVPAPSNFVPTGFKPGVTEAFYRDRDELLADLVAIVRDEIQWLIAQGVGYIQLDAPFYSHYLDPEHRDRMKLSGTDPDAEFDAAVAGDNATFSGLAREGVTMAMHVCRGNSRSRWYTEGGYDLIAERLFTRLDVDRFLLEYDTERSGTFEPLRLMPRHKDVVLGLITTKEPALEREDDVRRRIDQAARYMPIERLAISPQCGFASIAAGNLLSEDDQWKKLELVARVARKTWTASP
ncbi:MAG TPA: cobalamin-independent methionine synthase II family protein [Vicinamibacterales bacterium]|nr:cobalamin-independent methionine synthase II family protein [Vicinamibacterales bacterium]